MTGLRPLTVDAEALGLMYLDLKDFVVQAGYDHELDWQADVSLETSTEVDFMREAGWVVLSTGLREKYVRERFRLVSRAFLDWRSATEICQQSERCRTRAMTVFANSAKIDAILEIVGIVAEVGYERVKESIRASEVDYLRRLPYVGPVTSFHLAKNLGLDVVKPDRHLVRIARATGYASPLEMCSEIATAVGDSVAVVDLVCWRFATLNRRYEREIKRLLNRRSRATATRA
ncbi:MAG: hypothetical protein OXF79_19215 [Chloroflexi bacterium]|nr:hypothetical protein [Chloroflexota bacterium]